MSHIRGGPLRSFLCSALGSGSVAKRWREAVAAEERLEVLDDQSFAVCRNTLVRDANHKTHGAFYAGDCGVFAASDPFAAWCELVGA